MLEDLEERDAACAAARALGSTRLADADEPFVDDDVGGVVLLLFHSLMIAFLRSL